MAERCFFGFGEDSFTPSEFDLSEAGKAWQDIQRSRLPDPGENGQKGPKTGNTGVRIFWELQDANGRTVQNGELKKMERKEGFCADLR